MNMVDRGGKITEPKPLIMKVKRRRHEPEFKARVALEALKGIKTIQQIAKEYQIHPVQVSDWKKKMLEGTSDVFTAEKNNPDISMRRQCELLGEEVVENKQ